MKEFFDILFDYGEGFCTGDAHVTEVSSWASYGAFFCINPLSLYRDYGSFKKPQYKHNVARRADVNVTCLRNFMFEMDELPVEDQLKIFTRSDIPFTSIVYSGGKSCHAILSVDNAQEIFDAHDQEGISKYKECWRRLAAKLDLEAKAMGYVRPAGVDSFIDSTSQNPSRLSRYPEMIRKSTGVNQELKLLTKRINKDDFLGLLSLCPVVKSIEIKEDFQPSEDELLTLEEFMIHAPAHMIKDIKYCYHEGRYWAGPSGCYKHMYRLTTWAIDATNVSYEAFVAAMEKYTFKTLLASGYPEHKLMAGVNDGFKEKRGLHV